LDEDGIVALVTSSLRDFSERREPSMVRGERPAPRQRKGGAA
jgi:hypothetical protein